jgi:hypothetical protein
MASRSRCGICEKTTSNKKQKLHLVTIDGEDKLQFGYYSHYNKDLNKVPLNTKVHEKCYKNFYSKWYKAPVENVKASSDIEHGIISINDANGVSNQCRSSNVCSIRINDDDRVDDDRAGDDRAGDDRADDAEVDDTEVVDDAEIDDDDGVEMKETIDEANNHFCSKTILSNESGFDNSSIIDWINDSCCVSSYNNDDHCSGDSRTFETKSQYSNC